jgi:hypothetical protein
MARSGRAAPHSTALGGLIVTAPRNSASSCLPARHTRPRDALRAPSRRLLSVTRAHSRRQGRGAGDDVAPRAVHGPRRDAVDHRRAAHRTAAQRSVVRRAPRRQPAPGSTGRSDRHLLSYGGDRDANRRAAHDRRLPAALLRAHPRQRRQGHRREQDERPRSSAFKRYIAREPTTRSSPTCPPPPAATRRPDRLHHLQCRTDRPDHPLLTSTGKVPAWLSQNGQRRTVLKETSYAAADLQ